MAGGLAGQLRPPGLGATPGRLAVAPDLAGQLRFGGAAPGGAGRAYARGVAGAVVMVILLVILFPVAILVGGGILAAALGSLLKGDADASNRTEDGPNEYLELSRREAETCYPRAH